MNKMIITAIIVILTGIIGYASYYFLGKDNAVEEACEAIIKAETGSDVELSPDVKPASTVTPPTSQGV